MPRVARRSCRRHNRDDNEEHPHHDSLLGYLRPALTGDGLHTRAYFLWDVHANFRAISSSLLRGRASCHSLGSRVRLEENEIAPQDANQSSAPREESSHFVYRIPRVRLSEMRKSPTGLFPSHSQAPRV